ncbi:unnamed protein product, partial [Polarella glacialis]
MRLCWKPGTQRRDSGEAPEAAAQKGGSSSSTSRASRSFTLDAPSGPLRALCFTGSSSLKVLLLAAAPREAFLWNVSSREGRESPVYLVGVEALPPAVPALAFDETGALAAVGGCDSSGLPQLLVFQSSDGAEFARAAVAPAPDSPTEGEGEAACGQTLTASCFLRGDLAFVLVAATHAGGSRGSALVFDLRSAASGAVQ